MKICAKCNQPFKNRSSRYCSLECSGDISRGKRHGLSGTREHATWLDMRNRCRNLNYYNYAIYGGRGIKVCERWDTFENFLADMGPRPSKDHSLDRIDNYGDYEPSNCKWSTRSEQSKNRRPYKEWRPPKNGRRRRSIASPKQEADHG